MEMTRPTRREMTTTVRSAILATRNVGLSILVRLVWYLGLPLPVRVSVWVGLV